MDELPTWDPLPTWFLSFVDPDTEQFAGGCLVQATNMGGAVAAAHLFGCNPGGQVLGVEYSELAASLVLTGWRNRLLNREDCERIAKTLVAGVVN